MTPKMHHLPSGSAEEDVPSERLSSLFVYPASLFGAGSFMCVLIGFMLVITLVLFH